MLVPPSALSGQPPTVAGEGPIVVGQPPSIGKALGMPLVHPTARGAYQPAGATAGYTHPATGLGATQPPTSGLMPQPPQQQQASMASAAANATVQRAAAQAEQRSISVGLHGVSKKQAIGSLLNVYYNEDGASVPYAGICEAVDPKKGLKVRLDGYSKREWVTDDDEWEWAPDGMAKAGGASGGAAAPRPVEFIIGAAPFREALSKLTRAKDLCTNAAKGEHVAAAPPKAAAAKRAAGSGGGGAAKRGKKQAAAEAPSAGEGGIADGTASTAAAEAEPPAPPLRGAAARKRKAEQAALVAASAAEAKRVAIEGDEAAVESAVTATKDSMQTDGLMDEADP